MYVCICNAITEKQVRSAAMEGATDLMRLQQALGVGAGCGSCKDTASEILSEFRQRPGIAVAPVRYHPKSA